MGDSVWRVRFFRVRVWLAAMDIKSGKKIHEQVEEAIKLHDKLLLVLSDSSMQSEWVVTEIYKARERERWEGRRVLFPIRLVNFELIKKWKCFDADSGKDMAREVREYYIPDFSGFDQPAIFRRRLKKLLVDLKKSS